MASHSGSPRDWSTDRENNVAGRLVHTRCPCPHRSGTGCSSPGLGNDRCPRLDTPRLQRLEEIQNGFTHDLSETTFNKAHNIKARWLHNMETLAALLVLCEGDSSVTCGFPSQRTSDVELWHSCVVIWGKVVIVTFNAIGIVLNKVKHRKCHCKLYIYSDTIDICILFSQIAEITCMFLIVNFFC